MPTPVQPITFNETSYNVALLHRALEVFGLTVAEREVAKRRAGTDTRAKVRALQESLGVQPNDALLVDRATIAAMAEALAKRGYAETDRSFTVAGLVRFRAGAVRRRLRLLAFDLDLRGAGVYRSITSLEELDKSGGFEFLGEAAPDDKNAYELTFYDWQYRRAERKLADVVVYAVEAGNEGTRVLGRSRLVTTRDYSDQGLVRDLDVFITAENQRTEYEGLMELVLAFLRENDIALAEVGASRDQLGFTASELDLPPARLNVVAAAGALLGWELGGRAHELLYGIGRQAIRLTWPELYSKPEAELRAAVARSAKARIIRPFGDGELAELLKYLHDRAVREALAAKLPEGDANPLDALLATALPEPDQRAAFLSALTSFEGADFREFWQKHLPAQPAFQANPQLIDRLALTQQLALLSGQHQPLIAELQVARKIGSIDELFALETDDWLGVIANTGVPAFAEGADEAARARGYAEMMQSALNAAFPTKRIARMLEKDELPIEKVPVARSLRRFLAENAQFDIAASRVGDFDEQLAALAKQNFAEAKAELLRMQRVFQVSTSPKAMGALMEHKLDSAYSITAIPRKSFVQTYGEALGGETIAYAIHMRAEHVTARAEHAAAHLLDYVGSAMPAHVVGAADHPAVATVLQNQLPNYAELFGSPDICECEQCRSVYSAAAYLVELLRFLWRGAPNSLGKTPLAVLEQRRPDLVHLPLTCENTNTIIPYIDLANEVMEFYTAHTSLAGFRGYDTGEATAEELRANPQNFDMQAYGKLKDAKYPFTLPYHQPLDVIRTYSDHLGVSRYEALKAAHPQPNPPTAQAIAAEGLRLAQEEYIVLTGAAFDGTADTTPLHEYFGYAAAADIESMSAVREFLRRSGVAYTDLVELVKTRFINPHQGTLDFLDQIFASAALDAPTIYARLGQIAAGALNPAADADITAALVAYNTAHGTSITPAAFGTWVTAHLAEFRQVVTLFEPDSTCDLDTTSLRTMQSIYEAAATSGITSAQWSKIHRFTRLWRKLGWSIHETDVMLAALGQSDITATTIERLESVSLLASATKLAPSQLAVAWGAIDTAGKKSLYRKLFLNKAVQQIDPAFEPDAWGDFLTGGAVLGDHQSALIAAFRMREEDLAAILRVARVTDLGALRPLNPSVDLLNLANVSTLYRYVMLAKALKLRVADLCTLVELFGASPFSTWDVQLNVFTAIAPENSSAFCTLVAAIKQAGFKVATLEYILRGTTPAESSLGLDRRAAFNAARAIRSLFDAIERDHPDAPPAPLAADALAGRLALTFQPEIVARLMAILDGTAASQTITDANLAVEIPTALAAKYTYVKGSGRLTCAGVMTDAEQATLKALANATANFRSAVDALYAAPEQFIAESFSGVLSDLADANRVLLDHPAQPVPATAEQKLAYIYLRFVPILKGRLRRDAITQHLAALIGLSQAATALLAAADAGALVAGLATAGFSATYYSDATLATTALQRVDPIIDFGWGSGSPAPAVPADNFSARWQAYVAAPASGEYTLRVDVAGADESFRLYLDDALILEKAGGAASTSWEAVVALNASQLHRLRLDYAELAGDAGARLLWMTTTTAPEVIPASAAYPAAILDAFVELAARYDRAAQLILGFGLSEAELGHLLAFPADFGNLDFKALTAAHWRRISAYAALRDAVPQAQARLTDVFAAARTASPAPSVADLTALLHKATAWDAAGLEFLVTTHFGLAAADFRSEVALNRLRAVMEIIARTGLSAQTVAEWGEAETVFAALNNTAQLIKNTVKAKYEERDWLDLAGSLSDTIRAHQQAALIAYLLTQPAIQAWGARDADGLFEFFLIDVQMGACMDTSRVVQASAAIQMFVNRCLLNLESDMSTGAERGVSPAAIDPERWEWMQNYRVWEANRKVFLYAENWLEPEWRNDRSEFFRELESYLVQNDITARSVEQGFRNYLASLNEVANLDVCGIHRESYDDGKLKYLHVFARTQHAPYKYFYRRWNEFRKWSAWERVPVDIRSVEATGDAPADNSGVQLVPVVWKRRLFLFWAEFAPGEIKPSTDGSKTVRESAENRMSSFEPQKYNDLRLGWSEYVDRKWTPKQISKEYLRLWLYGANPTHEKDCLLTPSIDPKTQELTIEASDTYWNVTRGAFKLADIQAPISVSSGFSVHYIGTYSYGYEFSKRRRLGKLELEGDVYLDKTIDQRLLPVDTYKGLDMTLAHPFFFSDAYRSYFVRPVDIAITEGLKKPFEVAPYLPHLVDDSLYYPPHKYPPIGPDDYIPGGPDDYLPGDSIMPEIGDGLANFEFQVGGVVQPLLGAGGMAGAPVMRTAMLRSGGDFDGGTPEVRAALRRTDANPMAMYASADLSTTGMAFGGVSVVGSILDQYLERVLRWDTGLEFHTFYHPYSSEYVRRLNQGGLPRLMESDTALGSDSGATFEDAYSPIFSHGFVQKPADFATRTYYKQNVCFDVYGANSIYNWELFFHAPLYIATRLSKNGKYAEAMRWFHYIFDPTTDALPGPGESEVSRYWKVLPFKATPAQQLEDWFRALAPNTNPASENATIAEWRDNPFDPHLVAANRPLAYMKHVVIKYVENLVAWGDSLFRQFTRESVNEALQIYVIANHILGPRPELVPRRGEIRAETYDSLRTRWDDFSNALVALENAFPYSSTASIGGAGAGTSLLGIGSALYFCIPANDKLLGHWDTVADRLFKIRHCQDIDGVERKLALFAPPIDPAALIQAASQGLSLGSILADLSSPPPIYRFSLLIQKANEFCADVRVLGAALLGALEKKDAEELARLRAAQETQMLGLVTAVRERAVLDARANRENLQKGRELAGFRLQYYVGLLGNQPAAVPAAPTIGADLTADSQLPADTALPAVATDVDVSLVDSDEGGVKLIPKEKKEIDSLNIARDWQIAAQVSEGIAAIAHIIPTVSGDGKPFGIGVGASWGGTQLGNAFSAAGKIFDFIAGFSLHEANIAQKMSAYIRREQDWVFQANLARHDIIQLDKQITAADIRVQVAQTELANHRQQILDAEATELFLRGKFTNQELYQWMKEQLLAVYKQSYNLAFELAKKAEKAYKFELGTELASFIQYGYWDDSKQGLMAGERLQLALRQLESSYLNDNRRELELTRSISLLRLDPLALIRLRETGVCTVAVPEELFDLDFQGHYFRRLKAARLSIPCVAGPYTPVSCTLRLISSATRANTAMNSAGNYERENDEGVPLDDDRFRVSYAPVTAIATSSAQNDAGVFDFAFRDERYLPFEGAGAISQWQIELAVDRDLRQFDYATIADVILHLDYTARASGGLFKQKATTYIKSFLKNSADLAEQPLAQLFSLRHEFPTEWHRFLHVEVAGAENILRFRLGQDRFPFLADERTIVVMGLEVFARCTQTIGYDMALSYVNGDGDRITSTDIAMPPSDAYGGLNKATVAANDAGMILDELVVGEELRLKLKRGTVANYASLVAEPPEVEDVFFVVHYKLEDTTP